MSTPVGVLSHLLCRPRFGVGNILTQLVLLGKGRHGNTVSWEPITHLCPCGAGGRINQRGGAAETQLGHPSFIAKSRVKASVGTHSPRREQQETLVFKGHSFICLCLLSRY